jgi:predicted Zn-dependent protease with MMP-like domain
MPVQVSRARFAELVGDALDTLPTEFTKLMRNVVVTIDDGTDPHLLGLYEGVPLTERTSHYSAVLPDKITIFQDAICARATTEADVADEVRATVVHEVGHHFGIGDERLHELGW